MVEIAEWSNVGSKALYDRSKHGGIESSLKIFTNHLKLNLHCDTESIAMLEAWFQVTFESFRKAPKFYDRSNVAVASFNPTLDQGLNFILDGLETLRYRAHEMPSSLRPEGHTEVSGYTITLAPYERLLLKDIRTW